MEHLLARWLGLSELERRAFVAMAQELSESSSIIEYNAVDLSQRFRMLADNARAQVARVEAVIATATSIKAGDQEVTLSEATSFIDGVLAKMIDTVLSVSKNAMRMVYALDDVAREVEATGHCVTELQAINKQTRFLALNAAIEAARAGKHGGAFEVIAREIRELSKQTDETVKTVNGRVAAVVSSVGRSHEVLKGIATADMSEHIIAKERLDALLAGMIAQNSDFTTILAETAGASSELSATIAPLIMGLQFQDRTAQHLAHVIEALGTLGEAGEALRRTTHDAMPGTFAAGEIDRVWLQRMIETQTLGEVRKRFLAQLVDATPGTAQPAAASSHAAPDDGGAIELF